MSDIFPAGDEKYEVVESCDSNRFDLGWNKLPSGGYVLILPNGRKCLLAYQKAKNGQKYYQILTNPRTRSSESVWYKTKNLDKAKEVRLRLLRNEYQDVVDFINTQLCDLKTK